jgi:hypothetical protein
MPGVSPKVASTLMGHKTPEYQPGAASITLRRYTHTLPGEPEGARDLLGVFLKRADRAGSDRMTRSLDSSLPRGAAEIDAAERNGRVLDPARTMTTATMGIGLSATASAEGSRSPMASFSTPARSRCPRGRPPPPIYLGCMIPRDPRAPGWQHAAVVIGEACLHCGRALDAATAWRVAIAVVGPDDQAGAERALGALHPRCIAAYLAARDAGRRRHRRA